MIWRMIFFGSLGFFDEYCCRQEVIFFQDVAPSLKETSYSHVKTYFIGMEDRGDSNFFQYVLLNQPSRIKSVVLMEDLTGIVYSLRAESSVNYLDDFVENVFPKSKHFDWVIVKLVLNFNTFLYRMD